MPSVPCLTFHGFARWQTLQLLLSPEESMNFLQKAVQLYRIPRRDSGTFTGPIPRSCFPQEPDEAMEKWYTTVTGTLNQDNYMRRLKASPYQSPHPDGGIDGYFHNGHASRNSSSEDQARIAAYRRRSSVPDAVSPVPVPIPADRPSHWDRQNGQSRKARSHSAQRPVQPSRQRSHTTSTPDNKSPKQPSHHSSRLPSQQWASHRHRISDGRSPHSRNNSASDASSENSHADRKSRPRRSNESPKRRKGSLWPPSFFKSHRRRHSSDASTQKIELPPPKPPLPVPLRPEYYHHRKPQVPQVPYGSAMPVYPAPQRAQNGVRFNDHIFDDTSRPPPDSPTAQQQQPPPTIRYPEPRSVPQQPADPSTQLANRDSSSGSDRRHYSDWERGQRRAGFPSRMHTVSGVGGRQYPHADMQPADAYTHASRTRGSAPTPA